MNNLPRYLSPHIPLSITRHYTAMGYPVIYHAGLDDRAERERLAGARPARQLDAAPPARQRHLTGTRREHPQCLRAGLSAGLRAQDGEVSRHTTLAQPGPSGKLGGRGAAGTESKGKEL